MIAYLQGTTRKKFDKSLIIDTGAVGYLVHVPTQILSNQKENDPIELYIHTKVREDDISLYGFQTLKELDFFKALTGISGIGSKLAMEILSQNTDHVKGAILQGDAAYLTKIPGIGKKTAERIIVELKNKVEVTELELPEHTHGSLKTPYNDDVVNALTGLGYQRNEIMRVLKNLPEEVKEEEEIITYFLRHV